MQTCHLIVILQLYWVLWYHGLLLSALVLRLSYELLRKKLHPYPSLTELREHRSRIDRSQAFGTVLATRLAGAPALGLRDVWDIFGDYRRVRKLKKAKGKVMENGQETSAGLGNADDAASVYSVSLSTSELLQDESAQAAEEEADLKRLGLFLLNEVADLLERIKKYVRCCSLEDGHLIIP